MIELTSWKPSMSWRTSRYAPCNANEKCCEKGMIYVATVSLTGELYEMYTILWQEQLNELEYECSQLQTSHFTQKLKVNTEI